MASRDDKIRVAAAAASSVTFKAGSKKATTTEEASQADLSGRAARLVGASPESGPRPPESQVRSSEPDGQLSKPEPQPSESEAQTAEPQARFSEPEPRPPETEARPPAPEDRPSAAEARQPAAESNKAQAIKPEEVLKQPKDWDIAPSAIDFEDPLLRCLTTLAGLLQRPISAQALQAGLPHAEQRFTPELAVRAAERAGLEARITRRPKLRQILPVTLPCILLLEAGNACVLLNYLDKDTAEIVIPEGGTGKKTICLNDLEDQYTGYAIFARPEFKFDQRASDIRLAEPRAWFWGTLAKFWPIYGHVLLASVLINCFAIASPLFIMNVYDRVVPNNAIETLWVLALGVATVFVFEFIMRNLRTYFVDVAGKNADVIIASRLL
ncbi:MAG: cysteine peptidase family C39 domain-containing protein, partial [Kiloniellaceae bacterium]